MFQAIIISIFLTFYQLQITSTPVRGKGSAIDATNTPASAASPASISEDTSSVTSSNSKSRQNTPKSTGGKSSGKITENSFSDKVRLLAKAAKDFMRMRFAYGDVFPPTDAAGRATFAWDIIKKTSQSTPVLRKALREATRSETVKKDLITFVGLYFKHELFAE